MVHYKKLDISRHTDEIGRIISTVTSPLSSRCLDLRLPQTLTKVTGETETWQTREVWGMSSHGLSNKSIPIFPPPEHIEKVSPVICFGPAFGKLKVATLMANAVRI